ncbi:hypothetical protein LRS05_02895 [Flavobacterium sp. J372]|uniref:hypothetical protein n=1 Tax=Flavobacterium sp. J372 TaxID=2898436 RepID=UPI002150B36F|nr:hypothetical protein [Flavobacterium sp. J372]MCR5861155.1 hypothetical protein [Flavobacterium sp. J372]
MKGLEDLEEKAGLDDDVKERLLKSIQDFGDWLTSIGISYKKFDLDRIKFEPFSDQDWIMRVKTSEGKKYASFNPYILKNCSYEFFEIVILHEYFHLIVQGVPNKEDATKIKDDFGSDFMSLIDIEADFYVAYYYKEKYQFTLEKYWTSYFDGSKIFIEKLIRNKKFERFLGSVLTINKLFESQECSFDLYLPSISPVFTQEKMSVLVIRQKHIAFEQFSTKYEDFRDLKKLYIQPDHLSVDGYIAIIKKFTDNAFLN